MNRKKATVYVGPLKEYQEQLTDIGQNTGTIECLGHHSPSYIYGTIEASHFNVSVPQCEFNKFC
jgi:hypothetical protein